jgi:uncharacterized protein YqeY
MLRENIQNALKEAMKSKDMLEVNAIRMIIAGIKEKDVDARGKGNKEATDADLLSMMQTMIKQRRESIEMFISGARPELAQKEEKEIKIIERFLPKQLSKEEVEAAVKSVIASTAATSMKDMGKVMGQLRAQYAGQMDFGAVSAVIKSLLS